MTNCSEMPHNLFRFTHFRKNAPATPLVSHTFKTTIRPGMVVLSEHREPKDPSESCKPFRLIHFRKNVSASPLESHTFKTLDCNPFTLTTWERKGGGLFAFSNIQPQTDHPTRMAVPSERSESRALPSNLCPSLTPLDSALTFFLSANPLASTLTGFMLVKSFTSNTYEKHTGGGRGYPYFRLSTVNCHLPATQARSARFPFRSGRGRRLFSWRLRSRWKESRALLPFEQASPATGRSGSSRRRSRDWRRGVCGNALRRRAHRRSSHIPSPGRSGKRRRQVWRRRTLRVSGGASWPVGT